MMQEIATRRRLGAPRHSWPSRAVAHEAAREMSGRRSRSGVTSDAQPP